MYLSKLQKLILIEAYCSRAKVLGRARFSKFYAGQKVSSKVLVNVITKSLERLIDRELMIGHGTRTPHKWYIKEVKLTPKGRRVTKDLLGKQQPLPFRKRRSKPTRQKTQTNAKNTRVG